MPPKKAQNAVSGFSLGSRVGIVSGIAPDAQSSLVFAGNKRKGAADGQADDTRKKAKGTDSKEDILKKFATWTYDLSSLPRGIDYPRGDQATKMKRRKPCLIVTSPTLSLSSKATLWDQDWRWGFDYFSQLPAFVLASGGWLIRIGCQNFQELINADPNGDKIFVNEELKLEHLANESMTCGEVSRRIQDHGHEEIVFEDARRIFEFGYIPKVPKESSLALMAFITRNTIQAEWVGTGKPRSDRNVEAFVQMFNGTAPLITICRRTTSIIKEIETYWNSRARLVHDQGAIPFYNGIVNRTLGRQFEFWIENPDAAIVHHPWMQIPGSGMNDQLKKYASYPPRAIFWSMRHYEIALSVSLIHEVEYENLCAARYFSQNIQHQGQVVQNRRGRCLVAVTITRDVDIAMPTVNRDTRFTVHRGDEVLPEKDTPMEEEAAPADELLEEGEFAEPMEVDDASPCYQVWKAKATDLQTDRTFIISFSVTKDDVRLLKPGSIYEFSLEMERNSIPTSRMLTAIGKLAKEPEESNTNALYLRPFLLGETLPEYDGETPLEAYKDLSPTMKKAFDQYVGTMSLNKVQKQAWDGIFNSKKTINMIQGPPGTGKTAVDVAIAMTFALLNKRTAVTAPTNKACDSLMMSMVNVFEALYAAFPETREKIKLIFFPTTANLKAELTDKDDDATNVTDDSLEDASGNSRYKPYMLWTHIFNLLEDKSKNMVVPDTKKNAIAWLATFNKIRAGGKVSSKELRRFISLGIETSQEVLHDPSVKVVVSTSNNAAQLFEFGWQTDALLMDENAFGIEHDSCVPLTLNAKYVVLSGDHEQLKPNCTSVNHNEYYPQHSISLFERTLKNRNVPLYRLNINYRMHPDIALLPGILSYGWLGCDMTTRRETNVYRFVKDFWYHHDNSKWRSARRVGEWNRQNGKSIRRLFFNVKNARSAHKDESTTSYVNFDNVQAIVGYVAELLAHHSKLDPSRNISPLSPKEITIVTGYKDQKDELQNLVEMVLGSQGWDLFPEVVTIDSIQGGENEIIILDLTPANEHHGSLIGFLSKWNRMNVALTRAKQHLFVFGNINCWRTELKTIVTKAKGKKFALFLIDLLDLGDIVDVQNIHPGRLPADVHEVPSDSWSREMTHMSVKDSVISDPGAKAYRSLTKERAKYERQLLQDLTRLRGERARMEADFLAGKEVDTPLFNDGDGDDNAEARGEKDTPRADHDAMDIDNLTRKEDVAEPAFQAALLQSMENQGGLDKSMHAQAVLAEKLSQIEQGASYQGLSGATPSQRPPPQEPDS